MRKALWFVSAACAVSLVGLIAYAQQLGGVTNLVGKFVVQDASEPTCATATSDGDLCVDDALECNGALDVGGAATLRSTLNVTGALVGSAAVSGATLGATTTVTSTSSQYVLVQADLGATCTIGELKIDTATTKELCYCQAANTWYCISFTTATGPTD